MFNAPKAAATALDEALELVDNAGLAARLNALVTDVWQVNLARYEPDELGDDLQTLGGTCAKNIANRVARLVRGSSDYEAEPWDLPGLSVARPNGALRLDFAGRCFYIMKSPTAHGRSPRWDALPQWTTSSEVREEAARANTMALAGHRTAAPGQDPLLYLPFSYGPPQVRHFVFVWAAEIDSPATCGWLGVPSLGDQPFAAVRQLWVDPEGAVATGIRRTAPTGPNFNERSSGLPALRLKPRPGREGEA
ncbi:hypothetical protein GCM10023153_20540 [Ornithinibacter aureus]|uniref:Uncharacterized protein n=1 Tax=Ornithinibacter aureus TaxID=622664 RepID=A0ABP8JW58_9MICO|nr:hypothetical protein [Ornithinibacter aureus]